MIAVDTNVLLYAHDPRDPQKQLQAIATIQSLTDGALLWQVACEYIAASRKLGQYGHSIDDAWQNIRDLRSVWTTILPAWSVQDRAENLMNRFSLSFWDALIIAACLEAGVTRIYTEDFNAYPNIDGLQLVNPFTTSP